jgi:hypothetical protein
LVAPTTACSGAPVFSGGAAVCMLEQMPDEAQKQDLTLTWDQFLDGQRTPEALEELRSEEARIIADTGSARRGRPADVAPA